MEDNTRISVVGIIIIEDRSSAEQVNELLHQYGDYIIGRMGLPLCEEKSEHHQRGAGRAHGCDQCPFGKAGPFERRQL